MPCLDERHYKGANINGDELTRRICFDHRFPPGSLRYGLCASPALAPTQGMLDEYKKLKGDRKTYELRFLDLMEKRKIEDRISKEVIADGCLLCSEEKPHQCHRRLVAEYLNQRWGGLRISHLG